MKLAKGYRSENNRLLTNNSIPYEEFKICGIHTANQIINAVGRQKMHEGEINTFDKNVLTLDCKKNQSIFHVSSATAAHPSNLTASV